ncbi:MAG: MFS transporter [Candidatus Methylomirabilales bacterium]
MFVNILGFGVIIPILPLYAEGQFGGSVLQITLLASSFFGAQFLAAPWLGRLSDRYGRRPLLMASQLGTVVAFVLFILAGPIGGWVDSLGLSLPLTGGMLVLFSARILDGITGGNITIAQAYVADITSDENRAQGLGYLQAAFGMGIIFGPAIGGFLSIIGPVAPFVGAAAITTGTLLLTALTLEESLPEEARVEREGRGAVLPSPSALVTQPALALILAIGFVASLAFSSLPATFALYANRVLFPEAARSGGAELPIALMFAFFGLMTVITQVALLRPLVMRLGERRLLVFGQIALTVSFMGLGGADRALLAAASLSTFAFGLGVSEPSLQSLVTRFGSRRRSGQMLGLYQSARSLALIFGPVAAGYVFGSVSPRATYWAGAGVAFVALLFALGLMRRAIPVRAEDESPAMRSESAAAGGQ